MIECAHTAFFKLSSKVQAKSDIFTDESVT